MRFQDEYNTYYHTIETTDFMDDVSESEEEEEDYESAYCGNCKKKHCMISCPFCGSITHDCFKKCPVCKGKYEKTKDGYIKDDFIETESESDSDEEFECNSETESESESEESDQDQDQD